MAGPCPELLTCRQVGRYRPEAVGGGGEVVKSSATVCTGFPVALVLLVNTRCVGEIRYLQDGHSLLRLASEPAQFRSGREGRTEFGWEKKKKGTAAHRCWPKGPSHRDRGPGRDLMVRDQGVQMGMAGRRLVRQ